MLKTILKWLESKTTTFKNAKECGEIEREFLVAKAQKMLICGNGIFGYEDSRELDSLILREFSAPQYAQIALETRERERE